MFPVSRSAFTAILILGLFLVFMPSDGVRAGVTAAPAKKPALAPKTDQAAKPAKTLNREPAEPADRVMKLDKKALKKLNRLPKNQRILVKGKEMTVGQYELKIRKEGKQAVSKLKAMSPLPSMSAAALQKEFEQKDAARLEAANAKVKAEMAKLGKQPAGASPPNGAEAIRREALAIQNRLRGGTATPADEKRAKELFDQYQQLK